MHGLQNAEGDESEDADADACVAALYRAGLYPRGLEVTGLGLEQAFLTITEQAARAEAAAAPAEENAR